MDRYVAAETALLYTCVRISDRLATIEADSGAISTRNSERKVCLDLIASLNSHMLMIVENIRPTLLLVCLHGDSGNSDVYFDRFSNIMGSLNDARQRLGRVHISQNKYRKTFRKQSGVAHTLKIINQNALNINKELITLHVEMVADSSKEFKDRMQRCERVFERILGDKIRVE